MSSSDIASDPRVLRQVRYFSDTYRVTTCGYGNAVPAGAAEHLAIRHREFSTKTRRHIIARKWFQTLTNLEPDTRAVRRLLNGRRFDAALVNDMYLIPPTMDSGCAKGVHVDMHEFWPGLADQSFNWMQTFGLWFHWVCRTYLPRAASVTTVSRGLQDRYSYEFGIEVGLVRNTTPYHELSPTPVGDPIRLVHSGSSARARSLDTLVGGILQSEGFTLDLFLTDTDPENLGALRKQAGGDSRITFHEAVPYDQLIDTLNGYDVGAYVFAPRNFNLANTLPNKTFDYVQARLGQISGPTPDIAGLLTSNGLGAVTDWFDTESFARCLQGITREDVESWKRNAALHAHALSDEDETPKWGPYIDRIAALPDAGTAEPPGATESVESASDQATP